MALTYCRWSERQDSCQLYSLISLISNDLLEGGKGNLIPKATIRLMEKLPGRLIISCVENDPDVLDVMQS